MDNFKNDKHFPASSRNSNEKKNNTDADSMIRNIIAQQDTFNVTKDQQLYSKLPKWMIPKSGYVHPLYEQIWQYVKTDKRDRSCDTNLVSQLLMTSSLSVDVLGKLWSMANVGMEGCLSQQELYIILALVTLVQNGYSVSNISLLQHIQKPIIPQLNYALIEKKHNGSTGKAYVDCRFQHTLNKFSPNMNNYQPPSNLVKNDLQQPNTTMLSSEQYYDPVEVTFKEPKNNVSKIIPITTASPQPKSLDLSAINSNFDTFDDEFSDFQSAQFTNVADNTNIDSYEFTDFQSAFDQISFVEKDEQKIEIFENVINDNQQDLINCQDTHDKYEVFRTLAAESVNVTSLIDDYEKNDNLIVKPLPSNNESNDYTNTNDDEFGDFLSVEESLSSSNIDTSMNYNTIQVQCINKCLDILKEGYATFSKITNEQVLREVINHNKGIKYIEQLHLISKICKRLLMNFPSLSLQENLNDIMSNISVYFNNISHNTSDIEISDTLDNNYVCYLCKCKCNTNLVEYMFHSYHSSCINLFVNFVQNT
ncbi:synergin gamma-like isoform X2 [Adelges cooleyi]|uniref:synergin gamma-like isoform X2 n=1 Tax=Adelges cooleyi TaxID=133065 RepID=UPI00217F8801|nr:synergin gamma-like isoform X2 [Adelges cooleyi]